MGFLVNVSVALCLANNAVASAAQASVEGTKALTSVTFTGWVADSDDKPVAGAVVVTDVGGQCVTGVDGTFALEVAVPLALESVQVTAVGAGALDGLAASAEVAPLGSTWIGRLALAAAPNCHARWLPTFGVQPGVNYVVRVVTVFDDGSGPELVAGGSFFTAGSVVASRIAKWNGTSWEPLGNGVIYTDDSFSTAVHALRVFDDGHGPALYAAGNFTTAGGVSANFIAKWNGASWSPVGSGVDRVVRALVVFDDGSGPALFAGGSFSSAGGVAAKGIAKWDGTSWSSVSSELLGGSVFALAIFDDGTGPQLHAAGGFTNVDGVAVDRIARWNGDTWSPLGSGLNNTVRALTVFDGGGGAVLCAGGDFTSAGGLTAGRVAKWDGATWSPLGSGLNDDVYSLAVFDAGSGPVLCAGGWFTNHIAKWNGTGWSALGGGANSPVYHLGVFDAGSGPRLWVGGIFTSAGGVPASCVAGWDGAGWSSLGSGLTYKVHALTSFDDGGGAALYAGGEFSGAGGVAGTTRIAKWDGASWSALGSGTNDHVRALKVFDDGSGPKLYAAGDFTGAGGVFAYKIAKWDGATWSPLPGAALNSVFHSISALAVFDDGSGPALFAGGSFKVALGVGANNIAKWNGTSWSPLGSGLDDSVSTLAVWDDGSGPALYAGGSFTSAGGVAANCVAKWSGTSWSPLGSGMDAFVGALTAYDDGGGEELCAGGGFTTAGGVPANRIAKWDGTSWSPLGSGVDHLVRDLAVFDDGENVVLCAGGYFDTAGGVAAHRIARWNGTSWSPFGRGLGGVVEALAAFDDGNGPALFAGGGFVVSPGGDSFLARWGCSQ